MMQNGASPSDTCKRLGFGLSKVYALCREGKLDARKLGRRTIITDASIRAYEASLHLDNLPRAEFRPHKSRTGQSIAA